MLRGGGSDSHPRREDFMNEFVDQRWKEFEGLGEQQVRKNLSTAMYGEDKTKSACAWLEQKASEKSDAPQRRAMPISKDLKDKVQKTREDGVFTLKLDEGVSLATLVAFAE